MRSELYTRLTVAILHAESGKIAVSDFRLSLKPFFRIQQRGAD